MRTWFISRGLFLGTSRGIACKVVTMGPMFALRMVIATCIIPIYGRMWNSVLVSVPLEMATDTARLYLEDLRYL